MTKFSVLIFSTLNAIIDTQPSQSLNLIGLLNQNCKD